MAWESVIARYANNKLLLICHVLRSRIYERIAYTWWAWKGQDILRTWWDLRLHREVIFLSMNQDASRRVLGNESEWERESTLADSRKEINEHRGLSRLQLAVDAVPGDARSEKRTEKRTSLIGVLWVWARCAQASGTLGVVGLWWKR